MGVEDKFDGEVGGDHGYDGVLSATVGLTYRCLLYTSRDAQTVGGFYSKNDSGLLKLPSGIEASRILCVGAGAS